MAAIGSPSSAVGGITLRVRTQIGTWRLSGVQDSDTVADIMSKVCAEHHAELLEDKPVSRDAKGTMPLIFTDTVGSLGLKNGDLIYATVNEEKTGVHENSKQTRLITKDGNIVAKEYAVGTHNGFRPGMMALKSMKMQWTLNDFIALDEQFVYKITNTKDSICTKATLDQDCVNSFISHMQAYDFKRTRVGYLYGRFGEDNTVVVECMYEPPQENTEIAFVILDDPLEDRVASIASLLGLKKVGMIFAHPPREKGYQFSGYEILAAAEMQLECAQGVEDTPFVTVKCTLDEEGKPESAAYQVSKQCMEMVAEGVISAGENLGCVNVNETFTAIVEGKETREVDNNFFLMNVPIVGQKSDVYVSNFPKMNREPMEMQTREDLKTELMKVGKSGWTFKQVLSDFQLLIFLCEFMDISSDMVVICNAIVGEDEIIEEGYQLMIRSFAGIDM